MIRFSKTSALIIGIAAIIVAGTVYAASSYRLAKFDRLFLSIDGVCKRIDYSGTTGDLFLPSNSTAELSAFGNNAPNSVSNLYVVSDWGVSITPPAAARCVGATTNKWEAKLPVTNKTANDIVFTKTADNSSVGVVNPQKFTVAAKSSDDVIVASYSGGQSMCTPAVNKHADVTYSYIDACGTSRSINMFIEYNY